MKRVMTWLIGAGFALSLAGGAVAQGQARLNGSDAEEFLSAIRKQDGAAVEEIFTRQGASVINYRGFDGETPLTLAMTKRSSEYVAYLVANGAEPDYPDRRGDTGLIIAARSGYMDGVEKMLGARANVDASNRQGETALIVAVQSRHPQIVRRLLEAGANPDKTDIAAGYSARDYAKRDTRNRELLRLIETIKPPKKAAIGPTRF